MAENKIFTPNELKTIEVDVEKKIFKVNGKDFGKNCTSFCISCNAGRYDEWFHVLMRISEDKVYESIYDIKGNKNPDELNGKPVCGCYE